MMLMKSADKDELIRHSSQYIDDTPFRANARLLQSKWREKRGFPMLTYGNLLEPEFAKRSKVNFLTENIRILVTKAVEDSRISRAIVKEPRIWNNLLSSQSLCFNLFGELYWDLDMASEYFRRLFPKTVEKVISIKFEYSPGRRDTKYLGDNSAFDAFIEYVRGDIKGFLGVEVKYSEDLCEESKAEAGKNYKERYREVTESSGVFRSESISVLRYPPLSQIWRDHLLALATRQDYDEGFLVFLFPEKNAKCCDEVSAYLKQLSSGNELETGFCPRHLEDFIYALGDISEAEWVQELRERYLFESPEDAVE
jgi:hypothetical protein